MNGRRSLQEPHHKKYKSNKRKTKLEVYKNNFWRENFML